MALHTVCNIWLPIFIFPTSTDQIHASIFQWDISIWSSNRSPQIKRFTTDCLIFPHLPKIKPSPLSVLFISANGKSITTFPVTQTKAFKLSLTSLLLLPLISNPSANPESSSSEYTQNPTTSHPSPLWTLTQTAIDSGSFQQPPNCFLCFHSSFNILHFPHNSQREQFKTSQSSALLKNFGGFPSHSARIARPRLPLQSLSHQCPCSLICLS